MDIERLSTGQAPQAIVLSCSDSRVAPEIVFDQKLGEMFTVRSAGEALSSQAIASIEFAIAKLGSKLIVVMGHTKCGAIKAAVDTLSGGSAGSENHCCLFLNSERHPMNCKGNLEIRFSPSLGEQPLVHFTYAFIPTSRVRITKQCHLTSDSHSSPRNCPTLGQAPKNFLRRETAPMSHLNTRRPLAHHSISLLILEG